MQVIVRFNGLEICTMLSNVSFHWWNMKLGVCSCIIVVNILIDGES